MSSLNNIGLVLRSSENSSLKIIPLLNSYEMIINSNQNKISIITYSSNGFIGIGTNNPNSKLEIKDGIIRNNGIDNSYLNITNNHISIYNSNNERIGIIGKSNNENYLEFSTENEIKGVIINRELLINEMRPEINKWHRSLDNNPRFYFSSNSLTLFNSSNGYQWNNMNNEGMIYISNNGNLGIGISNPKTNLHISTKNQFPLKVSMIAFNSSNVDWCKAAIGHIKTNEFDIGDLIFLTNNSLNSITINSNDERLRIKSNGLIGIGITNPNVNLHINNKNLNQEVRLRLSDNSALNGLSLYKHSNNDSYLINEEASDLIIGNNLNNKKAIIINSNNNLNINNDIYLNCSNNKTQIIINNNNNRSSFLSFENSNINIGKDIGFGSIPLIIHNDITINSNVGIGINPIEKLHVDGIIASINNNSNYIRILNENSTAFIDAGSIQNGIVFRINNSGINYEMTNQNLKEVMRIRSNGNIGIGNNNPITTGNDTNLCIGNSSLLNSSGFIIIGKNSSTFQRHFKLGYGDANYMTIGDFGTSNISGIWKQQLRVHWNCPNNSLMVYENGDANLYGRLYQNSDRKIKRNIKTIDDALIKVMKLNGIEYTNINDNINQIGLIAQEVEEIIPEIVNYNKETDLKSVAYGNLTPLLINAIKELNKKIEDICLNFQK